MTIKYISEKALAKRWNISHRSLQTKRQTNENFIPFIKFGKHIRYALEEVEAYEAIHSEYKNVQESAIKFISLKRIAKMPIERIVAVPNEDISKIMKEANEAFIEAKGLRDWIQGIISLKNSISNQDNNEVCIKSNGGDYEFATNY